METTHSGVSHRKSLAKCHCLFSLSLSLPLPPPSLSLSPAPALSFREQDKTNRSKLTYLRVEANFGWLGQQQQQQQLPSLGLRSLSFCSGSQKNKNKNYTKIVKKTKKNRKANLRYVPCKIRWRVAAGSAAGLGGGKSKRKTEETNWKLGNQKAEKLRNWKGAKSNVARDEKSPNRHAHFQSLYRRTNLLTIFYLGMWVCSQTVSMEENKIFRGSGEMKKYILGGKWPQNSKKIKKYKLIIDKPKNA